MAGSAPRRWYSMVPAVLGMRSKWVLSERNLPISKSGLIPGSSAAEDLEDEPVVEQDGRVALLGGPADDLQRAVRPGPGPRR